MECLQCRYSDAFVPFMWQLQLPLLGIFSYTAVLVTAVDPRVLLIVNWVLSHLLLVHNWELTALVGRGRVVFLSTTTLQNPWMLSWM